jgi:hypothetical protein
MFKNAARFVRLGGFEVVEARQCRAPTIDSHSASFAHVYAQDFSNALISCETPGLADYHFKFDSANSVTVLRWRSRKRTHAAATWSADSGLGAVRPGRQKRLILLRATPIRRIVHISAALVVGLLRELA